MVGEKKGRERGGGRIQEKNKGQYTSRPPELGMLSVMSILHKSSRSGDVHLTLKVPVTTVDALRHFETG